ncbi:xanthine dehydrogenase family protein molybdopterin-binding subunit [Miniphocaeibacter halophilus]|uniref:Molybdopterin-dependent oxidoreductase n=1 Tax=Miniphocaeibacter halophilus TaxID=2931922 RepID=A0AC61MZT9_9FIRM|nr:molybdopterin cofactor-binding domain-containing protein [Miniphocaeibacter halophilus]QQK08396.1 molybdopterin-dependent oxidoreductase [Miniphocaeibacter halophilus]
MIGNSIKKIDYEGNLLGGKSYTEDYIDYRNLLYIKVKRSPYAFAEIIDIDTSRAEKLEDIVAIYTYRDVEQIRYTECGESYPEASPHDRILLEKIVRHVGEEVAIIVGENIEACTRAEKLIKVKYKVFDPILTKKDSLNLKDIIHKEDDGFEPFDFGYDPKKNIVSKFHIGYGDIDSEIEKSDIVFSGSYSTHAQAHAMMETLRAYAKIDERGRLEIISANQSIYHMRRQVAKVLGLSLNQVRMRRIRIGGGFGGKNVCITEPIVGFVTWKTKRPSMIIYDRIENFNATSTRHEMDFDLVIGANKDGKINGIKMRGYNNTGAYGSNGPAVTMEAGQNTLPIYSVINAVDYKALTYYTNRVSAGAMRGYGTPQGTFALDSAINELSEKLGLDPVEVKLKNTIRTGHIGGLNKSTIGSFNIEECIKRGKELIDWDNKRFKLKDEGHIKRGVGMGHATHSSGVSNIDVATVLLRLQEDGTFTVFTSSSDLGTGSDTILLQIAAKALNTDMEGVNLVSGDTDSCPYDKGAYASCTTYLTGNAVVRACEKIKEKIFEKAKKYLNVSTEKMKLEKGKVVNSENNKSVTLKQLGIDSAVSPNAEAIMADATFGIGNTPRPYAVSFVEVEVNTLTGKVDILKYVSVIDCGQVINPNLARIQAEGGITQGIGFALYEDVIFTDKGKLLTNNFFNYNIPTRNDIGEIIVDFCPEKEPTGPFGAKSIAELVTNSPAPAIADAIFNACGARIRSLPITPEKIIRALEKEED